MPDPENPTTPSDQRIAFTNAGDPVEESSRAEIGDESFEFVYDGPNLASGTMNARALSEVLAGLSKAFSVVAHDNDLGDRYELRVRDIESGSFHILFEAVAYIKANPVAGAVIVSAAVGSWTVIKDTTSAAYKVITDIAKAVEAKVRLKGTPANRASIVVSDTGVELQLADGSLPLTKEQFELLVSRRIDKPLAQIVSPLAHNEVTSLEVVRAKQPLARVEASQRDYFDYQETNESIVREGTELVGRLNSLTKTSQRGTFYTADGLHVAYKYVGGDQALLLRGFSSRDLVRLKGRIRYDAEGVPTSIEVQDIESVQSTFLVE